MALLSLKLMLSKDLEYPKIQINDKVCTPVDLPLKFPMGQIMYDKFKTNQFRRKKLIKP